MGCAEGISGGLEPAKTRLRRDPTRGGALFETPRVEDCPQGASQVEGLTLHFPRFKTTDVLGLISVTLANSTPDYGLVAGSRGQSQ